MADSSRLNLTISIFSFSFLLYISSVNACHKDDEAALHAIKNSFPPISFPPDSWIPSEDCCSWDYVNCDAATGRVTKLYINNLPSLAGPIPTSIAGLSQLTILSLASLPGLVGHIPPQLASLKKLQSFFITYTGVSGPVPSFLSRLPSLQYIDLSTNKLSGSIPPSLGDLTGLSSLILDNNLLSGTIPASLFSKYPSSHPITLDLSNNKLTGEIPKSFGNLIFSTISLGANRLTGDASFIIRESNTAAVIDLHGNKLAFDLTNVRYPRMLNSLDISRNRIYGKISDDISKAPLRSLDVSYNRLCGKIPAGLSGKFGSSAFAGNKCLCGTPLPPCL